MKKLEQLGFTFLLALLIITSNSFKGNAQGVAINESGNSANASAMLDVSSTDKGLLIPRLDSVQRTSISDPATGLLVFQTDGTAGFYYYTGSGWIMLSTTLITQLADTDGDTKVEVEESADEDVIKLITKDSTRIVVDTAGRVGIGTSSPDEILHVVGSIKISDGNQEQGKVLVTDDNGKGQWQNFDPLSLFGDSLPGPDFSCISVQGELGIGEFPRSIFVSDNYAYIVDSESDDLKIIDVSNPASPALSSSLPLGTHPRSITVSGNYAYVVDAGSDDLKIIDISNPASPVLSGSLGIGGHPNSVKVLGTYAYIVDYSSDDLKVIDVSNPVSPSLSGSLGVGSNPYAVDVTDNHAYIVDQGSDDLKVIDVSIPASPVLSGSLGIGTIPMSVAVLGDYAYVVDQGSDDLKVIDVSNPASPVLSSSYGIGPVPSSVAVSGNYAYVVDYGSDDLKVINVNNPASLVLSGSIGINSSLSVAISGNYAYVGSYTSNDLKIIKLSCYNNISIDPLDGSFVQTTLSSIHDADHDTKIMVEESADEDVIRFTVGDSLRMIIDTAGNVGIGTSSPSQQLDMTGSIKLSYTTLSNKGIIYKGNTPFLHNYRYSDPAGIYWSFGYNTFLGLDAGNFSMGDSDSPSNGSFNTAIGANSLHHNDAGASNTATGFNALNENIIGYSNCAIGSNSMKNNQYGSNNTAIGNYSLYYNISNYNCAFGYEALYSSFQSFNNYFNGCNTAIGAESLHKNTSSSDTNGINNTAVGYRAGYGGETYYNGYKNIFIGYNAGNNIKGTAHNNVVVGYDKLLPNAYGNYQMVLGDQEVIYGDLLNKRVGVGTITPNQKLTLNGDFGIIEGGTSPTYHTIFQGGDQSGDITYILPTDDGSSGEVLATDGSGVLSWNGTGDITAVGSMASGSVFSGTSADDQWLGLGASAGRIEFDNQTTDEVNILNANVGIGSSTPLVQLHITDTEDAGIIIEADTDNSGEDDNPRMEFRQDGGAVVGAVGLSGNNDVIYTGVNDNALYMINEYNTELYLGTNSLPRMTIQSNGSVKINNLGSGNVYSNSGTLTNTDPSDRRLKENIISFSPSLDKVMQLRPVTFNWKEDGQQGTGFIAQEVEAVIPELVGENADGYKGIYTTEMIPYLVNAMQEQQEIINSQQNSIMQMQQMNEELLKRIEKIENNR